MLTVKPVEHLHNLHRLLAGDAVMHLLALASGADQAVMAQHRELLRQGRLHNARRIGEVTHAVLTLGQLAEQQQAVRVAEHFQQAAGVRSTATKRLGSTPLARTLSSKLTPS